MWIGRDSEIGSTIKSWVRQERGQIVVLWRGDSSMVTQMMHHFADETGLPVLRH
jgi:hypothetical protein